MQISEQQRRWPNVPATPVAAIALTILMLCVIGLLAGLMIWQNYGAALRAGEARAKSSAHVVAAHIEWMIEASDQALRRIDAILGEEPTRASLGAIADISEAVGDLPEGFQYSVYDDAGQLRMSSVPEAVGVSVADREYFQKVRDGELLVISPQLEERLSGKQVFVIARRISRAGEFRGAASIAIPTDAMDQFWTAMELGPHSTVSVIRTDGWLVARHPQVDGTLDLGKTPLFTDFLPSQSSGVYHSGVSPVDGMSRIVGFRTVDHWPLVATTGVERGEALQFFWSNLRSNLLIGIPALLLLGLGTAWIVRLLGNEAQSRVRLEQAFERNQFLLREVHHRVKNNLQAVASLVQLQPLPKEGKEDMRRRIAAMVALHEQIYGNDEFDRMDLASYAGRLIEEIAAGYTADVSLETDLRPVNVDRDQALPVGLILNEAVSNAFKHAFDKTGKGRLSISLAQEGEVARLMVSDDGPGYMPSDNKRGMGSRLISGFVSQLGGEIAIENSNGTTVTVTFPVR